MTYTTLLSAIHNKVAGVTAIKEVFDYSARNFTKYPVACIIGAEFNDEDLDNKTKWRKWDFSIHILSTIEVDPAGTETSMNGIIESIMDAFASDYTLGGTCADTKITGVRGWLERETDVRITEVKLSCFDSKAI